MYRAFIPFLVTAFALSSGSFLDAEDFPITQAWRSELRDSIWGPIDPVLTEEAASVRSSCKETTPTDCGALAFHYSRTSARLEDQPQRAATIHRLACADGYAWACYLLGEAARRGVDSHPDAAHSLLQAACDGGERRACLGVAEMLERGDGVPADPARAEAIYERECEAGRMAGCRRLARLLSAGGPIDEMQRARIEALNLRACTGGDGASCYELAEFLEAGDAGADRVTYYYAQACDRRHLPGCLSYADRLDSGLGVDEDPALAASLFHKTCGAELAEACLRLASLYRSGRGVSTNLGTAAELETRACALGLAPACKVP